MRTYIIAYTIYFALTTQTHHVIAESHELNSIASLWKKHSMITTKYSDHHNGVLQW